MGANATSFKKGFDPRRHEFTQEERRKGYRNMLARPMPSRLRAMIRKRIRGFYRGKGNAHARAAVEAHRRLCG